jgi:hypothetical protein
MKRLLIAATALVGLSLAPAANATLVLDENANGGGFTTICSGALACSPGVFFTDAAGLDFVILGASSNAPGSGSGADVTQSTVRVTNNTGATQSVVLRAGDTGFIAPIGSTVLSNNIGGTVVTGSPDNLFSSFACANNNNLQNDCTGAFQTTAIISNITQDNTAGSNNNNIPASLVAPFSLTEVLMFTLGAGSEITFTGSADVKAAPEPASLALLGVGLLGVGFVARRKRSV